MSHTLIFKDCFSCICYLLCWSAMYVLFYSIFSHENIYMYVCLCVCVCVQNWQHVSLKFTSVLGLIKVSAQKSLFFCVCPKYPANDSFCKQPTLLQCLPKAVYKDVVLKGKASLEINIFVLSHWFDDVPSKLNVFLTTWEVCLFSCLMTD